MGVLKYSHPKYYAKRAVGWERGEREVKYGLFWFVLFLGICAAIIFAVIISTLWVGHFLLFDLLPSPHEYKHHAHGQLGHDYPVGWLRGVAMLVILVGLLVGLLAAISSPKPALLGALLAAVVAMGISAAIETSRADNSRDAIPLTTSVPLHCSDGTNATLNAWNEYTCPNYAQPECPDGSEVSQGNWQGVNKVSCDGRVIAEIR
jgi:hypothetical protein